MVTHKKQYLTEQLVFVILFAIGLFLNHVNWRAAIAVLIVGVVAHYLCFQKLKKDGKWFAHKRAPKNSLWAVLDTLCYMAAGYLAALQNSLWPSIVLIALSYLASCINDYKYNFVEPTD